MIPTEKRYRKIVQVKVLQNILILNLLLAALEVNAQRMDRIVDLRGYWKFNIGDDMAWADPDLDDSNWREILVPSDWEDEGFHGYDGYAWYRVNVELDLNDEDGLDLFLDMGFIDDVDEVYFNGKLIGVTGSFPPNFHTAYNAKRFYSIPSEIVNTGGINTIAVRVYDTVLNGGIVSGKIGIYTPYYRAPLTKNLSGVWKIRFDSRPEWRDPDYDDSNWSNAIVPGFWRELKNKRRGAQMATYRKKFKLGNDLVGRDDLVIVLGKIDDFDRVFLNGHLIGQTNDGFGYGTSRSYSVRRIYDLPDRYLNRLGENTIVVEVADIGGNAGIYEGPIGITTVDNFRDYIRNY